MQKSYALNTWLTPEDKAFFTKKSQTKAFGLLTLKTLSYIAALVLTLYPSHWVLNIIGSLMAGFSITHLFILGHDAAHDLLVEQHWLNKWIARFTYFFSLHSYSLWVEIHNYHHHRYTNIKIFDVIWVPLTKQEYDQLPGYQKLMYRFYRTPYGIGMCYLIEFWAKLLVIPVNSRVRNEWKKHAFDSTLVLSGFIIQPLLLVYIGKSFAPQQPIWYILLLGWLIPFLVWHHSLGMGLYLQHTHPAIPWYASMEDWKFHEAQIKVSTQANLMYQWIDWFALDVMYHTTHHVLPTIPNYNLKAAQEKLVQKHGEDVVAYTVGWQKLQEITRKCKLYDYDNRQWIDYEGNPT